LEDIVANDRCWLVCKVCGSRVLLAKHLGMDWYTKGGATYTTDDAGRLNVEPRTSGFSLAEGIEDFIEQHGGLIHGYHELGSDKTNRQPFAIEYEATAWPAA
jgi:hypothetical protein